MPNNSKQGKNKTKGSDESSIRIAKITAIQAVIVALITLVGVGITGFLAGRQREKENPSVTSVAGGNNPKGQLGILVSRKDLKDALAEAKTEILAVGIDVEAINAVLIKDRISQSPGFTATIVMLDPLGKIICQRECDEVIDGNINNRIHKKILLQIESFYDNCRFLLGTGTLKLKVVDVYPTISIYIIDDDLYTYSYPYHGLGTSSPILKFPHYSKNKGEPSIAFFTNHLAEILSKARAIADSEYQLYKTKDPESLCTQECSK
jgi:hypothetical protein